MILAFVVLFPALLGLLAAGCKTHRSAVSLLVAGASVHLLAAGLFWLDVPRRGLGSFLELDGLGLLFLSIVSVLFFAASLYSVPYLLHGTHDPQTSPRRYVPCLLGFLSAMTLVTATQHLAVMWAAVEATTLASAPLVYFYRRREALEAAWKYLLLCSVGIALALLGVFFLGIAASGSPSGGTGLTLPELCSAAPGMPRIWLKAAFVLALVGFGTKMGFVPLHTWLPDTHSQAPSPVSALLSGALLNCAFLAILRFFQVCLASGEGEFAGVLLIGLGLLSIGVASALLVGQRDYKRLFAYSSIENMGIVAVGVGLGGTAGSFGALLHAVNHSLCKAGLFLLAGNVLREFGTTAGDEVRGMFRRLPVTAALLTALLLAIGGTPPFGPFMSKFLIFQSAFSSTHGWVAVLFLAFLAVGFLGMAVVVFRMVQTPNLPVPEGSSKEAGLSVAVPFALALGTLVLGVYLPPPLSELIRRAAGSLGG